MESSPNRKLHGILRFRRKLLFATALIFAVGFDAACATGSEVAAGEANPAGKATAGGEIAGGGEVTETRLAEEQWERVDVAAMSPMASGLPSPGGAVAAPTAVDLPFGAGAAVLTPEVREHLDSLATRLSVESAHCRLDLRGPRAPRGPHGLIAESDARLTEARAAAVRRYLEDEKGIAETSITVGTARDLSSDVAPAGDCVLIALLD